MRVEVPKTRLDESRGAQNETRCVGSPVVLDSAIGDVHEYKESKHKPFRRQSCHCHNIEVQAIQAARLLHTNTQT
jgi:hypothetical protein